VAQTVVPERDAASRYDARTRPALTRDPGEPADEPIAGDVEEAR
jgi:hypothetical protein